MAQSSEPAATPTIVPWYLQTPDYSGGAIGGTVLDEDGKAVSSAVVTLWLDGKQWQHNPKLAYYASSVNPCTSGIYGNNPGSYSFSPVEQGNYSITADKDGFHGSATVIIDNATINVTSTVNIILQGYRIPVPSQEQLSYTGGIAGTLRTVQEYRMEGNVSLWRDGELVALPENPQWTITRYYQGREISFLFEHLAPGQYEVIATSREDYTDRVTINVTDHIEYVDIRSFAVGMVAPELLPVALPLVSIGLAALIIVRLRKVG
ncbi:MAG: carboxypeptidase-like regulatory domain-containing protein [Methanocella sp.]